MWNCGSGSYGCSRLTLNAGSLLQFCQVPILLRPLFIPLKSLVRDDTQQVRFNGKSTELVSQLARTALQPCISDMWRCTFYNIRILLVLRYMYLYKKQHIGDMLWWTSYKSIGPSKFDRKVCVYPVDINPLPVLVSLHCFTRTQIISFVGKEIRFQTKINLGSYFQSKKKNGFRKR